MTDQELEQLFRDLESDRVERKASLSDTAKIRQAICAFANDMPNHQKPGVLFIGACDDGSCAKLAITDELLRSLAAIRDSGQILPLPSIIIQKRVVCGCELAVVVVPPADAPPVRFNGRTWIRVGPTRATATPEEERRLAEKRRARDISYDLSLVALATLGDLDTAMFVREYLPSAVASDVIEENRRSDWQQLASLRLVGVGEPHHPTVAGVLVLGKSPADYVPGAYVQFLRVDGAELAAPILDQSDLHGPMLDMLRRLDDLLKANIRVATDISSEVTEIRSPDYPMVALQQLTRNAVMHRDYETTNAPTRITWFNDRIEIQNPGGPFGQVTVGNFGSPGITDYRNPCLAEALKTLGFVQRFGVGIPTARKALADNGNPEPEFDVQENHVLVTVRTRP